MLQKFGNRLDCYSAVGVHAEIGKVATIRAFFGHGDRSIRVKKSGAKSDDVVQAVYEELVAGGAA